MVVWLCGCVVVFIEIFYLNSKAIVFFDENKFVLILDGIILSTL